MLFITAISQDDGLTFREVLTNLPHDAGAIVIYALVALFVAFVWYGSRSRPAGADRGAGVGDAAKSGIGPERR